MAFLVLLALAELLLGLLTIAIGALIAGLESALTIRRAQIGGERTDRRQQTVQDYTQQLREIRRNCEQIEADAYLQNQLHYWNRRNQH